MGYTLWKALHVLGVVLWVGGMVYTLAFLRPALARIAPPERLALMDAVLGRFFAAVLVAVVVIVASGGWMAASVARSVRAAGADFAWPLDWTVMAAVGLAMAAIFGYVRLGPWRRFRAARAAGDPTAAAAALDRVRRWVTVNAVAGVALTAFVYVV